MTTEDHDILIDDLEGFRVIDNPLRQRILHLTRHPKSVREIAAGLGVPMTRLYYHVNMLEEAGFLTIAEVRKAGPQLERIYESRTGTIRPSPGFVEKVGDAKKAAHALAGVLFDITRVEVEAVLEKNLTGEGDVGTVSRSMGQLPLDFAAEFSERIEALAD
ncbi:MAG: helix-turn-helix domain-containing protein, partial [Acidimicrobiia bacterium]|nr:helix-turn-helix domain-containing protein [Acidimicrobiia bacterium]